MEFAFWFCIFGILFAYAGYPATMFLLSRLFGKRFDIDEDHEPPITIIITSANGEKRIVEKLENTSELSYPRKKLEVILALDAPTDNTAQVINDWYDKNKHRREVPYILTMVLPNKGGKEAAQQLAVSKATGSIVVFTDVTTKLSPETLYLIARHFSDIRVGGVDGMSKIESEGSSEGLYLKYENKIREWESSTCGLVTFGGCLFAARRSFLVSEATEGNHVIPGFSPKFQSDFRTALMTKTFRYHSVLDKEAVAVFKDLDDTKKEAERKHRTIVRGINTFMHHLYLLNPFKYGLFSYALFCHKLMKWLVPFFMITSLVIVIILTEQYGSKKIIYPIMGVLMGLFYMLALIKSKSSKLKIIKFFLMSNLAILKAWWSYLKGERFVSWKPSDR